MQKLAAAREVLDKLPVDSIDIIYRNWHYQVKYCQDQKYFDPSIHKFVFYQSNFKISCVMLSFYHSVVQFDEILSALLSLQTGTDELPADDENAIREYLCIKAYIVSTSKKCKIIRVSYYDEIPSESHVQ